MKTTFTEEELQALKSLVAKPTQKITQPTKKKSRYDNVPLVLGDYLKNILNVNNITDDEICTTYRTGKGPFIDKDTITRYKLVTQRDVDSGQCYSRGVPVRFMKWLYAHIMLKYATV